MVWARLGPGPMKETLSLLRSVLTNEDADPISLALDTPPKTQVTLGPECLMAECVCVWEAF